MGAIYEIPDDEYRATMREFSELLELGDILKKQVRKLSLGERMKCELAAALLHRPRVLFLDEPTIGLDVNMQVRIREFIAEYNRRFDAAVILTSHYMADVTALCRRIIVIDKGKIIFDGDLTELIERAAPHKIIRVQLTEPQTAERLERYGRVQSIDGLNVELNVSRQETSALAARLLTELPIADVTIEDPPIEAIIGEMFAGGAAPEAAPAAPELVV